MNRCVVGKNNKIVSFLQNLVKNLAVNLTIQRFCENYKSLNSVLL